MQVKFVTEKDYELWEKFCDDNRYSTFFHTTHAMKYYIDSSFNIEAEQKSFFLLDNKGDILACMPVFLEKINDKNYLSYGGLPLLNPLISNKVNKKKEKNILKCILEELDKLALTNNVKRIEIGVNCLNSNYINKNNKSNYFLKYDYLDTSIETCILDLSYSQEELFSNFTKGHKSAVKKGEKKLKSKIIDSSNVTKTDIHDFMNYYFRIAGKVTRPINTFDKIYEWIKGNYGVLLSAVHNNKVCGYSMIQMYKDTAYYAMACKDKDYFEYNISHFLQWKAIKYLKERKIRYYEVGIQDFNDSLHKISSQKDKSISKFKRGFGGFISIVFRAEKFYDADEFRRVYSERINTYAERNFNI